MKNKNLQVWFPFFFSLSMVAGMFLGYQLHQKMPWAGGLLQSTSRGQLQEVLDLVKGRYVDDVNTDSLRESAIDEMLSHLDPHSLYIPAKELSAVNEDLAGKFEGIGVEFNIFEDTVHIITVLKDGPSDRAGLKAGDQLVAVEGKSIAGKKISSDDVKALLKGPSKSTVKVAIRRGTTIKDFSIQRGFIPLYALDASYMLDSSSGYIRINKFSETTYEEFMEALEKLQARGMKQLVLDLRDNGGGILNEAVEMADEFLSGDKLIVYTEGKHNPRREYKCRRRGLFETGTLILLMNEGSASASEVLAGALQDWDRAIVVGRRSFGKGLVQEQYSLSDGAALRLTVARYYTPLGRSIQKSYDNGRDVYRNEIGQRIHDGMNGVKDTAQVSAKTYKTMEGKILYDGGGITPDEVISIDTTGSMVLLSGLYAKNTLGRFVYRYYVAHNDQFQSFQKPSDFARSFKVTEPVFQDFLSFARKDSISLQSLSGRDRLFLEQRLKSLFARQLWRTEGYFEVTNAEDPMITKAIDIIRRGASAVRK